MTAGERRGDARRKFRGQRSAKRQPHRIDIGVHRFGDGRESEAAVAQRAGGKCHDRCGERRQRTRRDSGGSAQRADLAVGDFSEQCGDQIGLAGEIAIDGSGRDAGARGNGRDLHRRHAAFARRRPRRADDRRMPGREPAGDILGAAIGHGRVAVGSQRRIAKQLNHDSICPAMRTDQCRVTSFPPATWRGFWQSSSSA